MGASGKRPNPARTFAARCSGLSRRELEVIRLVAVNVFKESVRDKVLYNLVLFAVLLMGASVLLSQLTAGQEIKIIKDLGLAATSLFGLFIAVFIGIGLVSKEVEKRSIYSLLAKLCLLWLGDTPFALRFPAVAFGLLGIGAVYALGRKVASAREGLLAAALLAVSYHHVWFSQNARGYTALAFFALSATLLLLRVLEDGHRRDALGYAVVAALGTYTHLTMACVVAAHLGASLAVSFVFRVTLIPSAGALSAATSTAGRPPRSGWQIGQTDSGSSCSAHQSPLALKTGTSAGLHFVQIASSTPCSPHMSSPAALTSAVDADEAGFVFCSS